MKKASSSLLLLVLTIFFVSLQTYAQVPARGPITEKILQNVRANDRLRLADLLRLSAQEQRTLQIISLSITAQSLIQGPAQLELRDQGQLLATEIIKRQLKEVKIIVPANTSTESLELVALGEMLLDTIVAEVAPMREIPRPQPIPQPQPLPQNPMPRPIPGPQPQPIPQPIPRPIPVPRVVQAQPQSLLTVKVNQQIRIQGVISIDQLVRSQLGVTLEGAQIERVVIQGQPLGWGRSASVQVEINQRPAGMVKYLSASQKQLPIPLQSWEEARSLDLIVSGDAIISEIRVRVGAVRPIQRELPRLQRVIVGQEISARIPLELSWLVPSEARLVRSISLEARSLRSLDAQVALVSRGSQIEGSVILGSRQSPKNRINLMRPVSLRDLRLESLTSVLIDAVEIEFEPMVIIR